ncbi:MAG: hypothetical protein M3273_03205 [Actinomycetota bacterium]|nr:hypothetical protein [Actinomycetota bacterium]
MTAVLVAGVPRSGTSWAGKVLGKTRGTAYVNEPDNENQAFAFRAKIGLGLFPVLEPGDDAPGYETLWDHALGAAAPRGALRNARARVSYDILKLIRKKSRAELDAALRHTDPEVSRRVRIAAALSVPRGPEPPFDNVVVKSVHCALAVEWIARRWDPRVIVVFRDPLNTIASWIKIGIPRDRRLDASAAVRERLLPRWDVALPGPAATPLERLAWQFGVLTCALQDAAKKNPSWTVITHEQLYSDARGVFPALCERVGLPWSEDSAAFLDESNRPGTGYRTNRVVADLPQSWRKVFGTDEARAVAKMLERFPLEDPASLQTELAPRSVRVARRADRRGSALPPQ